MWERPGCLKWKERGLRVRGGIQGEVRLRVRVRIRTDSSIHSGTCTDLSVEDTLHDSEIG